MLDSMLEIERAIAARLLAAYRRAQQRTTPRKMGLNIGGKPPTKRRAAKLVSMSNIRQKRRWRLLARFDSRHGGAI